MLYTSLSFSSTKTCIPTDRIKKKKKKCTSKWVFYFLLNKNMISKYSEILFLIRHKLEADNKKIHWTVSKNDHEYTNFQKKKKKPVYDSPPIKVTEKEVQGSFTIMQVTEHRKVFRTESRPWLELNLMLTDGWNTNPVIYMHMHVRTKNKCSEFIIIILTFSSIYNDIFVNRKREGMTPKIEHINTTNHVSRATDNFILIWLEKFLFFTF